MTEVRPRARRYSVVANASDPRRPYPSPFSYLSTLYHYKYRILLLAALIIVVFFTFWEPHVELTLYSRHWIKSEIESLSPLKGCFNEAKLQNSTYNVTFAMGPKRTDVQAGMPMRFGLDCYDFAGTIQPDPNYYPFQQESLYHTYWRVDLASFGERQEWMLKSFFATQNLRHSKLILWSNGDLSQNPIIKTWLKNYPDSFELRITDIPKLARGTALQDSPLLKTHDDKAWVDGDLLRLLLLWNYGGAWVDMDTLLTRDLSPLLEHEFVTQWDCYDKKYSPFNGALMNFFKNSPYLCEFFHLMASGPPPRGGSTDWGSTLYLKLWRRLVANGIPPFKILPFCFSEGRSCRLDNRLPDPFKPDHETWANGLTLRGENSPLDKTLKKIFAIHLHNQWEKSFPEDGWVDRYLLRRFDSGLLS
ncbi:hypothetical protein Clacol_009220 [Clathrus columnatus]|uniref:Glycosyltransferase family 32 protein n=1 Tax=Clathrus columnatus TaxID=1419009 RepID=A0AAV5ASS5_9AGAM|nr:hypothetical protein Clacol_009220 [Clathrus columnatus]